MVVESKVIAATGGAVASGGVVSTFVLWAMGVAFWGAPGAAGSASDAIAAVPGPIIGLVTAVVGGVITFVSGYYAPHTPKQDVPPVA